MKVLESEKIECLKEIANIIQDTFFSSVIRKCLYPDSVDCVGIICERYIPGIPCRFMYIAEMVYEAGYRKVELEKIEK